MKRNARKEPLLPIDHSKIIDGFAELAGQVNYQLFDTFCGICSEETHVTPAVQKHLLEVKQLPVKFMHYGAIYCACCAKRRIHINFLRKKDRWHNIENGQEALQSLLADEEQLKKTPGQRQPNSSDWPY